MREDPSTASDSASEPPGPSGASTPRERTARGEATRALHRLAAGDEDAADVLFPLVQSELRRLARAAVGSFGSPATPGPDGTLQATALIHEAWIRIVGADGLPQSRRHFLGVAAKAMRSILVDHARRRGARKRGDGEAPLPLLDDAVDAYAERAFDLVELDDALSGMARRDPRLATVVELRFFAGLTVAETAEVMEIGTATVERDWSLARLWLRHELGHA